MKENIMSKEAFNELIDGLEYVESLTEYGRKNIKYHVQKLQQENKKLNGAIQTYDILLKSNIEENQQLKDNWNKLKEFIAKEYYMYLPLEANTKSITILIDKMHELEGSDSNGQ